MTARLGTALVVALCCVACTMGTVADSAGPSLPSDTTGGTPPGGVQRAALSVRVSVDPADASLGSTIGIGVGGLTVELERLASDDPPRVAITDATGLARFEGLLEGAYAASVDRTLSAGEIALLPPTDRDVSVFAGAQRLTVRPPTASGNVDLVASRRGTLVLSEFFYSARANTATGGFGSAQYVEVYNASDTTIYLDGILLFRTALNLHRAVLTAVYSCATANAAERMDPTGVWAFRVHRFPGNGRDIALLPGRAMVVAVDAVDHRVIHPALQDLRSAPFEYIGDPTDPNNPGAADMIPVSARANGPGANFTHAIIIGLALPIARDSTELERTLLVNTSSSQTGATFSAFKIPRAAILDLGSFTLSPASADLLGPDCDPFTAPDFDRAPSRLVVDEPITAISRKSLGFTATGFEILQRTRTSDRDFEFGAPLRRSLLRPP